MNKRPRNCVSNHLITSYFNLISSQIKILRQVLILNYCLEKSELRIDGKNFFSFLLTDIEVIDDDVLRRREKMAMTPSK